MKCCTTISFKQIMRKFGEHVVGMFILNSSTGFTAIKVEVDDAHLAQSCSEFVKEAALAASQLRAPAAKSI